MTISAQSISLHWSDGSVAFDTLNFTLSPGFHALVGRNGCGKSSLVRVLAGTAVEPVLMPTTGTVHRTGSIGYVGQSETAADVSLAGYLGVTQLLTALERIAKGSIDGADFDKVGDRWLFADELQQQLKVLKLWDPLAGFDKPLSNFSGGERTRLRLFKAFSDNPVNLILDEPSNHLDAGGRAWLLEQCKKFVAQPGHALLVVSHDRQLLQHVDSVSELDSLGLHLYEGNYDSYLALVVVQAAAAEHQLNDAVKHKKLLQQQLQHTREKAAKRSSKGKSDRSGGGQAKVMLDFAKEKSQQSAGALSKQMERRQSEANQQLAEARQRFAAVQNVQLRFRAAAVKKKRLLSCEQLVLPHGTRQPLNMTLTPGDKVLIQSENGSGKSTLLNVITGQLTPLAGIVALNTRVHLLDQTFSLVDPKASVLDNLMSYTQDMNTTRARTSLAQAGLLAEQVHQPAGQLSGGETMKLALLMVTLQSEPELILLDEPDNHLDVEAKKQLAQAIREYQGAMLVVSHDATFIEEAGISGRLQLTM